MVITTNVGYEAKGKATIIWDNCFSQPGRCGFAVPEEVAWSRMAAVLSKLFEQATAGDSSTGDAIVRLNSFSKIR